MASAAIAAGFGVASAVAAVWGDEGKACGDVDEGRCPEEGLDGQVDWSGIVVSIGYGRCISVNARFAEGR